MPVIGGIANLFKSKKVLLIVAFVVLGSIVSWSFLSNKVNSFNPTTNINNSQPEESTNFVPTETKSKSSVNIDIEQQTYKTQGSYTNVKINGQDIPVPKNGEVQQQVTTNSGDATLDVKISNSSNNNDFDNQSLDIYSNLNSDLNISINSQTQETVNE